ncbi:MAG TPA: sigma-70 family RNA polymerase sigma factor [Steroidobacter sp.]|uniref:RNA polymerase sigma factor n=1 Tax=Steroidobacter sp. TaxID=1978227 RepID=UPI002EDA26AF
MDSLQEWFKREIVVHEGALVRFISRVWPNRGEVEDIRQEAYVKVYEAAAIARPGAPKSFLFTVARNLMADRIRRSRIVSIELKGDLEALNVLVDELSAEERAGAREDFSRLARAFEMLPAVCREVVWLRKVESLSQKDVSRRLGVPARTVEKRVARGVRLLAQMVFGDSKPQRSDAARDQESGHG